MYKIKIGLPSKGRLKDESLAFLKSKNLQVVNSFGERNYFFNIKNNNEIDGIFLHAREIIERINEGVSQFRVVPSLGATESYPFTGSSELITDITSTGSTLKANNLRIINDGIILKSSACIFVSKKIEKNKFLNLLK